MLICTHHNLKMRIAGYEYINFVEKINIYK